MTSEIVKARANRGLEPQVMHFRESRGLEVDVVIEEGLRVTLAEAKSGATIASEMLRPLDRLAALLGGRYEDLERVLVYGGERNQRRSGVEIVSWSRLHDRDW